MIYNYRLITTKKEAVMRSITTSSSVSYLYGLAGFFKHLWEIMLHSHLSMSNQKQKGVPVTQMTFPV